MNDAGLLTTPELSPRATDARSHGGLRRAVALTVAFLLLVIGLLLLPGSAGRAGAAYSCELPKSTLDTTRDWQEVRWDDSAGLGRFILRHAVAQGSSERVILALFETGLVESGIRNLDEGHLDSVGVFQQRCSQGWCAPQTQCMDLVHSTDEFLVRARNSDAQPSHSSWSAGQIAQNVQNSQYPDRYDAKQAQAQSEIARARAALAEPSASGGVSGRSGAGFWSVTPKGRVFNDAGAPFYGDTRSVALVKPIVGMVATATGNGYWLVASDGGVFSFGDAKFYGSTGGVKLVQPVVGMAPTATGKGYWLVASDGGVFSFGDAKFYGSTGGVKLNKPVVGMAATVTGKGYWLVASDGGVFSFGDAKFYGSTGGVKLNKPVVGMAATVTGKGYWLVASDGGILSYGDAKFYGSTGGVTLKKAIVGMAATVTGKGYWLVESGGETVHSFGDAAKSTATSASFVPLAATLTTVDPSSTAPTGLAAYGPGGARVDLARLAPGQEVTVNVTATNTGTDTWTSQGEHPVVIATQSPAEHASRLYVPGQWLSASRPGPVGGAFVAPGQVGAFTIRLVAPSVPGTYSETFGLLAQGIGWLSSPAIGLRVVVVAP